MCWWEQCAEAEPLKLVPEGWRSTASLQVTSSARFFFLTLGLGAAKAERHQKTNAQPALPLAPLPVCTSSTYVPWRRNGWLPCVSVSSHVMPLPALHIHLVTNLPLISGGGSLPHSAHCEGPGEESSPPGPRLPSSKGKQGQACLGTGASGFPGPVRCQRPATSSAHGLSPKQSDQNRNRRVVLLEGVLLFFKRLMLHLSSYPRQTILERF